MSSSLEVLFAPAEFVALSQRDLRETVCVVFDVLRATSTMITALGNGAVEILPVGEILEAMTLRRANPALLLAGERGGLRIRANQTGSLDFDLGNSPREFSKNVVSGRSIAITTTNGTRALQACARAQTVLVGSFLNLDALVEWIVTKKPRKLMLICAGTIEEASYEDTLCAGAVCERVWPLYTTGHIADSAAIALHIYQMGAQNLTKAVLAAANARRLLGNPDLKDDVEYCLRRGVYSFNASMTSDARIRII